MPTLSLYHPSQERANEIRQRLNKLAEEAGCRSAIELLEALVDGELAIAEAALPQPCFGWIELDRHGDFDPADGTPATCRGHGGEIEGAIWMAVMGDGRLTGPYCGICATSD